MSVDEPPICFFHLSTPLFAVKTQFVAHFQGRQISTNNSKAYENRNLYTGRCRIIFLKFPQINKKHSNWFQYKNKKTVETHKKSYLLKQFSSQRKLEAVLQIGLLQSFESKLHSSRTALFTLKTAGINDWVPFGKQHNYFESKNNFVRAGRSPLSALEESIKR